MCFKHFEVLTGKKCYLSTKHSLLKMTDSVQLVFSIDPYYVEKRVTVQPVTNMQEAENTAKPPLKFR